MYSRRISTFLLYSLILLAGFGLIACEKEAVGVTEIVFTNVSGKKTLQVGDEFTLKYLILPEELQENAEIVWETSDKNVAKVKKGKITAEGPGTATISARSGQAVASLLVTVKSVPVESLVFPSDIEVYLDATVEVKFSKITPEDASLKTVDWKVETYGSGNAIVEADNDRIYITGTEEGVAELYGYISDKELGHCEIVIKKHIPVESVSVQLSKTSVTFGESLTVTTVVSPSNASLKDVTISCNPPTFVTIDGNVITAGETAGKITVSAVADGVTGTAEFEITAPPLELTIESDLSYPYLMSPDNSVKDLPSISQFTLSANYDIDLSGAVWNSSNTSVATVDANGLVKAVGHGYADITATLDETVKTYRVRSLRQSSFSLNAYERNSTGTKVTSIHTPSNQVLLEVLDPAFKGDSDAKYWFCNYYNITPSVTGPLSSHMETDICVINALSAGTGSVTLSVAGGQSTTISLTMKIQSLTFIGHQSGRNYGTVQKGGSLTITKIDDDPRPGIGTLEAIEAWCNVGTSKDQDSLYDRGVLYTWASDKTSSEPIQYGYLNRNISGTHKIRLTEFDPEFSVTLTIITPEI